MVASQKKQTAYQAKGLVRISFDVPLSFRDKIHQLEGYLGVKVMFPVVKQAVSVYATLVECHRKGGAIYIEDIVGGPQTRLLLTGVDVDDSAK